MKQKVGIRDGSFSQFSFENWEKEPSLIPTFYCKL